jgi:hypothetical protein
MRLLAMSLYHPRTMREKIIKVLANREALSMKQIRLRVKSERCINGSMSYQGLYKHITQLLEDKILVRKNGDYSLNIDWIKNMKRFCEDAEYNLKMLKGDDKKCSVAMRVNV